MISKSVDAFLDQFNLQKWTFGDSLLGSLSNTGNNGDWDDAPRAMRLTIGEIGCWFSFSWYCVGEDADCPSRSICDGRIGEGELSIWTVGAPSRP